MEHVGPPEMDNRVAVGMRTVDIRSMRYRPMPGQENTDSVNTAPANKIATWRPIKVTTGIMAFFKAWP